MRETYQYESIMLVKDEWNISQSIKFKIFCVFSECMNETVWDMLIKDASDVSNNFKQNASFLYSFSGVSVSVLDMPCVRNTHCHF